MSKIKINKMLLVFFAFILVTLLVSIILFLLKNNINFFYTPTQILHKKFQKNCIIRLGGVVVKNSVFRKSNLFVRFQLTDYNNTFTVIYNGILPNLFKEGQEVVVKGKIVYDKKFFIATEVLSKHSANYIPYKEKIFSF
ncbi:cytochrome c biogenesis protein CcmE [Candidatus Legionella polyplacis]|uniref:Cytochrome c-type biogenesis protein CcmE n=1 Tax=Candidatus Legionella polyplacis TaxID=2005262 RepID=A0ABZ2GZ92_9GAMM|nr:cytochrome c maturation protein CcmE [Candidatus Legionella polyplacis]ATW01714.1 cytochrome c biogenesis protein CcmE [Candidatus Legionella polyplacis]